MKKIKFNAVEVLEMAREIEKKGEFFYSFWANKVEKEELKKVFLKLAEDEKDHYDTFARLSKKVKKELTEDVEYIYNEQVSAYLRSLVEFSVFPANPEELKKISLNKVSEILNIAIMAEKESILFYQEILKYNKQETAKVLKQLINEEKQHLMDLTNYLQELA